MNLGKKIVAIAAGAALVAGAGAMASTPATAAAKGPQPKGNTVITVPMEIIQAATTAGVTIAPMEPATADATMDSIGVIFPVTGPLMDGVVHHSGGLSLTSATTKIALTLTDPTIEYATSGGDTAQILGEVGGVPDAAGGAQLNGNRAPIFDVTNMVITNKAGKITKNGKKGFKRTFTQTITGDVSVVNNDVVTGLINQLMGVALFKPGMPFGELDSSWSVTRTCKTKKACS